MPWEIRPEGGQYCVYQANTDELVDCHPTRPEAEAHLRALYANVDEDFGMCVDRGFFVDLFTEGDGAAGSVAQRALAGEPITIIPRGTFWRDGIDRHVDDQAVGQFVENWHHRLDRGLRRSRLAVDADHDGRAIGWYKDVMPLPTGVGAAFSWNRAGRQALEESEFAYFSASVYWQMRDRVTNQWVHNVVAGGALTNYPFFGEQTALFSLDTGPNGPPVFYAVTKTGPHGDQLPARAYLVVEDPAKPSTWHLPVMSYRGGKLVYDHKLMGAAKAALTAPQGHRGNRYEGPKKAEALARLKRIYKSEGLEFSLEGGFVMSDRAPLPEGVNADEVVTGLSRFFGLFSRSGGESPPPSPAPEVEALTAQVEALTAQVESFGDLPAQLQAAQAQAETYRQQVEGLQTDLGEEREARTREHFAQVATTFAHLPCQTDTLADHLRWLHGQDSEEGQPHVEFFTGLLRAADQSFTDAFRQVGSAQGGEGSAYARIKAAVTEYRATHPEADREAALAAVFRADPSLYQMYEAERQARAREVPQ